MTGQGVGASIIRTLVPFLVAVLIGQAARIGLDLDEGLATELVTAAVFAVYYGAARWIEANVNDQVGRALLSLGLTQKRPTYTKTPTP